MKNKKILTIIANGERPDQNKLHSVLKNTDIIIAIDGGANHCEKLGIRPNFIVGDLDSIDDKIKENFPQSSIVSLDNQDFTDMEKTLEFIKRFNPTKVNIFAASGKRSDHNLSNLIVFNRWCPLYNITIFDNYGTFQFLHPGIHELKFKVGTKISLISIHTIKNLILKGFKYPVSNMDFTNNFIGMSNVIGTNPAYIEFAEGILMIYELSS